MYLEKSKCPHEITNTLRQLRQPKNKGFNYENLQREQPLKE